MARTPHGQLPKAGTPDASIAGAAAVLGRVGILASLMPAARAWRLDVLRPLRSDKIVSRVNVDDPVIRG